MVETETTRARSKSLSWAAMTLIFANIGLGVLVVVALYTFGSIESALGYLRGDRLIPEVRSKSFGTISGNDDLVIAFRIKNLLRRPVRVLGAKTSCTCLILDDLPMTLPPTSVSAIRVRVRPRVKTGRVAESIQILTDYKYQSHLDIKLTGEISNR
jgi:hypothetical protein